MTTYNTTATLELIARSLSMKQVSDRTFTTSSILNFQSALQWLSDNDIYHTIGNGTVSSGGYKIAMSGSGKYWNGVWMTYGGIARYEMDRLIGEQVSDSGDWKGSQIRFSKLTPPFLSINYAGYGVLVDMVAAYHQIYKYLPLNIRYSGIPRMPVWLDRVAKSLKDEKVARNSVIGIVRSTKLTHRKGVRTWMSPYRNKYLKPLLWKFVRDVLHGIAHIAKSIGAVHIHTDGYIFTSQSQASEFCIRMAELGVLVRVEESGACRVRGLGMYSVGNKITKHFDKRGVDICQVENKVVSLYQWMSIRDLRLQYVNF